MKCNAEPGVMNGKLDCNGPFGPNSYLSLCDATCNEGYKIAAVGPSNSAMNSRIECGSDGQWTVLGIRCESKLQIDWNILDCEYVLRGLF